MTSVGKLNPSVSYLCNHRLNGIRERRILSSDAGYMYLMGTQGTHALIGSTNISELHLR